MTTPVWPSTLPEKFITDGFQESMGDGRLRSDTETGPGKVRRRFSAVTRPLSGQMVMDDDQLETLVSFVDDTLEGGTLPFTFPRQRPTASSPDDDLLVTIGDKMPSWVPSAPGYWNVTLELLVMP